MKSPKKTKASPSTEFPRQSKPTNKASESRKPEFQKQPNPPNGSDQSRKPRMLLIGDSITNSLDTRVIAQASDSNITKVKAYSAVYDDVANEAKQAARYPQNNYSDIAQHELGKAQFDILLLQAGSVDITNLKTRGNPTEHFDYFNQQTVQSAKNTFSVAVDALNTHPSLQKVVICKQIPRYDTAETDPLQLKSALSHIFNNTLVDQWMKSPLKDKIYVGTHNIDCSGGIREARYRCTKSGRYDGVHLYGTTGPKAYTNSVINILKSADIISEDFPPCQQFQYQNRKNRTFSNKSRATHCNTLAQDKDIRHHNASSVPTCNRFNAFSGNF